MAFDFLRPFFGNFNPQIIAVGAVFIIFFAFIYYILSKVFKDQYGNPNKAIAGIISLCISALIIYYGEDFLIRMVYSLNLPENMLNWIIAGVLIIFAVFVVKKVGLCGLSAVIGAGFIIVGLTGLVYRTLFAIIIGSVLLLWGIWRCYKKRNPNQPQTQQTGNTTNVSDITNIQERQERQKRVRSILDLKHKYTAYIQEKNRIQITFRRATGQQLEIAKNQLKRIRQALETIIEMARRQGVSRRKFLSSKYGVSQRSPGDLKWNL